MRTVDQQEKDVAFAIEGFRTGGTVRFTQGPS